MHQETGIPLVATNDSHYTYEQDQVAHDILLCIQTGKLVSDTNRMRYEGGQYYLKSEEEMRALFPYAPEAIENTHRIAMRCQVEITFGEQKLPHYEVPDHKSAEQYLRELCEAGFEKRYAVLPEKYTREQLRERMEYELSTIKNMG